MPPQRLDAVETACCGMDDSCMGVPDTCSVPCALVFTPFYEACGVMMGRLLDDDPAGTAQVDAFDSLDDQCSSAVDLGSALGMLRQFLQDDHDLLLPTLDGFETYRHFDPQSAARSQSGAASSALVGCEQGWTVGDPSPCGMPPQGGSCCSPDGRCGMRCPNTPSGPADPCIPSMTPDQVRPPKLTVAFSQSSYILMTYRVVGSRTAPHRPPAWMSTRSLLARARPA